MPKLTFDEALERLNDQRRVKPAEVSTRALNRKVWVAEWHLPGCLSESFEIHTTKADAVTAGLGFAEDDDGFPRGMATALRKHQQFTHDTFIYGTVITTIEQRRLREILT